VTLVREIMTKSSSQLTIALLALSLVSCTVAPALVSAEDTLTISNVARSSVSTGGQNGQDGQNGQSGEDGADGVAGKSGVSITNVVPSNGAAEVTIITTVDGQEVSNLQASESAHVAVVSTSTSTTVVTSAPASEAAPHIDEEKPSRSPLAQLFVELQLIIFTYVSYLF